MLYTTGYIEESFVQLWTKYLKLSSKQLSLCIWNVHDLISKAT